MNLHFTAISSVNFTPESDTVSRSLPLLRSLLALLVVEAAGVGAFALAILGELALRGSQAPEVAIFLVLAMGGAAWALVTAGRALLRGSRVARGFAITWQLFQIFAGLAGALGGGPLWAVIGGWTVVLLAVVAIVLLMLPPVIEATTRTSVHED
ncbi:hypothetical protein [Myceligenerans salitolerans]|uniref:Uncharacterized protein n=1 Tax=Myceligenerans salitolerans TaxID=1230528 RepID=A0ABS3I873_9MICO|nr:hypothetical protein [Myceligenerans salitolerans]MBO0609199.1 hypothetical protein [Myceligenerans salitolerans]